MEILSGLIEQKRRRVKACTEYERNGKLIRFAVGRGFEMEAVCRCVKQTGEDDVYLD
jgi:RecX family.